MKDVLADFTTLADLDEFWENLAALLTDEVVILEAQAVGMDWPELGVGRRRLRATRRAISTTATMNGWITRAEASLFGGEDARGALEAARPWIEREQRTAFDAVAAGLPSTGGGPGGSP
jgi:hypothetical protein